MSIESIAETPLQEKITRVVELLNDSFKDTYRSPWGIFSRKSKQRINENSHFSSELLQYLPASLLTEFDVTSLALFCADILKFRENFTTGNSGPILDVTRTSELAKQRNATILFFVGAEISLVKDSIVELVRERGITIRTSFDSSLPLTGGVTSSVLYLELSSTRGWEIFGDLERECRTLLTDLESVRKDTPAIMAVAKEIIASFTQKGSSKSEEKAENDLHEIALFLESAISQGFIFLGCRSWATSDDTAGDGTKLQLLYDRDHGIFKSTNPIYNGLCELENEAQNLLDGGTSFLYSRTTCLTNIGRRQALSVISIKARCGSEEIVHLFVGLMPYFFMTNHGDVSPICRKKFELLLKRDTFSRLSISRRTLARIFANLPRIRLLQAGVESLEQDVLAVLQARESLSSSVTFYTDVLQRFLSTAVVIPKNKFSDSVAKSICEQLATTFSSPAHEIEIWSDVISHRFMRIHLLLPLRRGALRNFNPTKLHEEITVLTYSWQERIYLQLAGKIALESAVELAAEYEKTMPAEYRTGYSAEEIAADILKFESLNPNKRFEIDIDQAKTSTSKSCRVKIYADHDAMTLTEILARLQECGFEILRQSSISFSRLETMFVLYDLTVQHRHLDVIEFSQLRDPILSAFSKILARVALPGRLNELIVSAQADWREVSLMRTYEQYLVQLQAFRERAIVNAIISNPEQSAIILSLFRAKFGPDSDGRFELEGRDEEIENLKRLFNTSMKKILSVGEDRILRVLFELIDATTRTNFYQLNDDLRIAVKIDCTKCSLHQSTSHRYEIYVFSREFQGVLLKKSGFVSAGARWSYRSDYRNETLYFLRNQAHRNSIIAPDAGYACFVTHSLETYTPRPDLISGDDEYVQEQFSWFVFSLLQLTDNFIAGKIINPEKTLCYDEEPDHFFVLFVDFGSPELPDRLNDISIRDFNYWLGDSFSPGAKCGLFSRRAQIRAAGTWIAAKRHLQDVGIDADSQHFMLIAEGSLSDAVFGNAMLQSENALVIAAYDDENIFLDPNPDALKSYQERKHLIEGGKASWANYNRELISEGGGVYKRHEREVVISALAGTALGIVPGIYSGADVVRAILCAPVDMLWAGGRNVLVHGSRERPTEAVGEFYDNVAIRADELRAKVIVEGQGPSVTQAARAEFSERGGQINTDDIDNIAYISLAARELNLKLALISAVRKGEITTEERDSILSSVLDQVGKRVLDRALFQNHALSLAVMGTTAHARAYRDLLNVLEKEKFLDRKLDACPADAEVERLLGSGTGLPRPLVALIVSYVRKLVYQIIIKSDLPDDPISEKVLLSYFPMEISARFPEGVFEHVIGREIVAAQMANGLLERLDPTFLQRTVSQTGASEARVIRAFLAADYILGGADLVREIVIGGTPETVRLQMRFLPHVSLAIESMARWILEREHLEVSISELVHRYKVPFSELMRRSDELVENLVVGRNRELTQFLTNRGLPKESVHRLVATRFAGFWYLDIIQVAQQVAAPINEVAKLYLQILFELSVNDIIDRASIEKSVGHWDLRAYQAVSTRLRNGVAALTRAVIRERKSTAIDELKIYLQHRQLLVERYEQMVRDVRTEKLHFSALFMLCNQFSVLSGANGAKLNGIAVMPDGSLQVGNL